jgi:hypothetical protein
MRDLSFRLENQAGARGAEGVGEAEEVLASDMDRSTFRGSHIAEQNR